MIPAGIERDRQIAELRGEWKPEYNSLPLRDNPYQPGRYYIDAPSIGGPITLKPYSTDISAAFELLQEMRDEGNYDALELVKVALLRWATSHEEAEELPGEISGAWLKWKEG